ncbi:MAG: PorV/PorQ family protein [Candidatus Eiseniibacteriota bacterium]
MRRISAILLGLSLLAARPAAAGIELAGTTGANFLTVGPGASIIGMGGAGLAGYYDLSGMTWNPASLGLLNESQLMFTHMPLPNSASQEWMAFGGRMGVAPTRWALSGRYEGDGSFEAKDALGNPTGTFNSSSLALGVNAARPLDRHTVVGMGAKFVNENLGATSGYGGTFDIGVVYRAGPFSLGAAGQNMGGSMKYDSLAYSMPLNFGAGLMLLSAKTGLSLAVDMNHPNAYYNDVRVGAEWQWKDHMALRLGYRKELNALTDDPLNGTSVGLGFGGHGMWCDYGYVVTGDGSTQQRVTLRVSPRDWGLNFADLDNPNPGSSSPAQASPPVAASAPPARTPAPAAQSSTASTSTPSTSTPAATTTSVAPAAAPTTTAPAAASSPAMSSAASVTPVEAAPAPKPKVVAPAPAPAPAPPPAPTPAAVMPPPIASTPSASSSSVGPASSAATSTPEPAAPSPALTTLVPVTPPAVPAPKPVIASHKTSLPAVSAPAAVSKPSEAPASAAAPAVAQTQIKSAVGPDGKPVKIHVKKGETLESIAKDYNTTAAAIMMENNLVVAKIKPGMELKIPNHQ